MVGIVVAPLEVIEVLLSASDVWCQHAFRCELLLRVGTYEFHMVPSVMIADMFAEYDGVRFVCVAERALYYLQ